MKYKDILLNKFMIRKSKKQKSDFIDWLKNNIDKYEVNVSKDGMGSRNIVFGDVDKASVIFTAHYDTCANMIVPNFITPTNIFIYLLYQIFLTAFLIGVPFAGATLMERLIPTDGLLFLLVFYILLFGLFWLVMAGPANKTTVNDNTSGVLTILEMINKIPLDLKDKVAFILFDYEEIGLIGSSSFATKHKSVAKNKLLINFDCVSDGDKMLFIPSKKALKYKELFSKTYTETGLVKVKVVEKGALYPSDQMSFKYGVGVCSVIRGNRFEYIDKIHTKKDTVLREENINYLVDKSIELVKNI